MKDNETLSDCISSVDKYDESLEAIDFLVIQDVKDAIKKLKKAICLCGDIDKTKCCYCSILNEIFGEKLTE